MSNAKNPFESMFETFKFNNYPGMGPSAEDMKKQMDEAQRDTKVVFKNYVLKTYVLNEPKQMEQYQVDMFTLIKGVTLRTHVIFGMDKEFVSNHINGATWLVKLEWGEFELTEKIINPVPSVNDKEKDNAEQKTELKPEASAADPTTA